MHGAFLGVGMGRVMYVKVGVVQVQYGCNKDVVWVQYNCCDWCKAWCRLGVSYEIGLGVYPVLLLGVLVNLLVGVGIDKGMGVG